MRPIHVVEEALSAPRHVKVSSRTSHAWVRGHWERRGNRRHWVGGRWVAGVNVRDHCGPQARDHRKSQVRDHRDRAHAAYPVDAPPAPKYRTPAPRANYVWVRGHYKWKNGGYVWQTGHWQRAKAAHTWKPGYWERGADRYVWVSGQWVAALASDVEVRDHRKTKKDGRKNELVPAGR